MTVAIPELSYGLIYRIWEFVQPPVDMKAATYEELQQYARHVLVASLISKTSYTDFASKRSALTAAALGQMAEKIKSQYVSFMDSFFSPVDKLTPLQLLKKKLFDILEMADKQGHPKYSLALIKDIQNITKLVLSHEGSLRDIRGDNMLPMLHLGVSGKHVEMKLKRKSALQIACANPTTPLDVVEFLLQKGEKPCRVWLSQDGIKRSFKRYFIEDDQVRDVDSKTQEKHFSSLQTLMAKYTKPTPANLASMPMNVKERIISYLIPRKVRQRTPSGKVVMTSEKIQEIIQYFRELALVDPDFRTIIFDSLNIISTLTSIKRERSCQDLRKKYPQYDHPSHMEERPCLLDALCSGSNFFFTPHTFNEFTSETAEDIEHP